MNAPNDPNRRSFFTYMAYAMGSIAVGASGLVMIDSMNPAADAWELGTITVDLNRIKVSERVKVAIGGAAQVLIHHRTPEDIAEVRAEDWRHLPDPQSDESRVQKGHEQWMIVYNFCAWGDCPLHLPFGNMALSKWGGWKCPCCPSAYDKSGRVRNGPARKNLYIPHYRFEADGLLVIQPHPRPLVER